MAQQPMGDDASAQDDQGQGAQDAQSGGSVGDVILDVDSKLGMLAKAAAASQNVPDDIKAGMAQIRQAFNQLAHKFLDSAQSQGGQDQADAGTSTPEQGGNPNAQPLPPGA